VDDSNREVCEEAMQTGMAWGFTDGWVVLVVRVRCRRRGVSMGGVRGKLTK